MSNALDETAAVRPLNALHLRLIATWAAQERDAPIDFVYDGIDGAITLGEAREAPLPATDVTVRANTTGRPVTLAHVAATIGAATSEVDATEYGAAFWSEASVQKFLFPYLAAISGGAVLDVLHDLDRLWNGYPDDRQVFALLHRTRRRPGQSLSLWEMFDVWYLDAAGSRAPEVMPAGEFINDCTHRISTDTGSLVPYRAGSLPAGATLPTEFELRRIAEWSSSIRTVPLYFRIDAAGNALAPKAALSDDELVDVQVIPALTPMTRPGHLHPDTIHLIPTTGEPLALTDQQADAAFWNSGTVDKVLLPYYGVAYGASALVTLSDIYDHWMGRPGPLVPDPIGGVPVPAGAPEAAEVTDDTLPDALVHLPKSDWGYTIVDPGDAVLGNLGVVYAGVPGRRAPWLAHLRRRARR